MKRPATGAVVLTLALLAVLGLVLITPLYIIVQQGFLHRGELSLHWFSYVLNHPPFVAGLLNSIYKCIAVTLLSLLIATPLALIAEAYDFRGRKWWLAMIQAPLVLPPFVGALGMKALLSRNGGINALLVQWGLIEPDQPIDWLASPFWATVLLESLYLYPIAFLNLQAALANIDPALHEAARNLGASGWRRFFRITLPLMRPGVFAAAAIVSIWSFSELGTPLMVGYRELTAVQIFEELRTNEPLPYAYALVVLLLGCSVALYLVGKFVLGRPVGGMLAKATVAAVPRRLVGWRALLATAPFAIIFAAATLPHLGVVLNSFSGTGQLTVAPSELTLEHHLHVLSFGDSGSNAAASVVNSFKYALIATLITVVLGFSIAYLAVRRPSPLTATLDSLAMLPLAAPGLVMAFGYFMMTQESAPTGALFGALNPSHNDPTPLLVIAYSTRRLPFMVRACAAGLQQLSEALEESSINLGASRMRTVLQIVAPLLAANFIAGGLLVFSRSMLEVSDSLILAQQERDYPMTKAIYALSNDPGAGMERASALGVWGMVLLIVTIAGASLALGKRLGALFRL